MSRIDVPLAFTPCLIRELGDAVNALTFSPDGESLASAGAEGLISIWNARTGRLSRTINWHRGSVNCLVFSPDGRYLASGDARGNVILWNVSSGGSVAYANDHWGWIGGLAFSPNGRYLAFGGEVSILTFWNIHNPSRISDSGTTSLGSSKCREIRFSPDGRFIVAAHGTQVSSGDAVPGSPLTCLVETKMHAALAFSVAPDGGRIAAAFNDTSISVNDFRTGSEVHLLLGCYANISGLEYFPDGRLVAASDSDGTVEFWDTVAGRMVHRENVHSSAVYALALDRHGNQMATADKSGCIKIWR
jgi:Tol biopolymer transport system component